MAMARKGLRRGSHRPGPMPWPPRAPRPELSCSPCTQALAPSLCSPRGAAWPLPRCQPLSLLLGRELMSC